jgi:hypothetical protein
VFSQRSAWLVRVAALFPARNVRIVMVQVSRLVHVFNDFPFRGGDNIFSCLFASLPDTPPHQRLKIVRQKPLKRSFQTFL